MAQERFIQPAEAYPLAAYNFRVSVGGVLMGFTKVTGLQREHMTQTYRDGLSFMDGEHIVKYFVDKYVPLTLERGRTGRVGALWAWLESRESRVLEVQLLDAGGAPALTWRVRKAVPVKLSAPGFDTSSQEVLIESLELMAAGITLEAAP